MYWLALLGMFLVMPLTTLGLAKNFGADVVAYISSPSVESECLVNGMLPPWVTINPKDESKTLYSGELVEMSLNVGKEGDGSSPTCQYTMRSKSNPLDTWNCVGLANSERKRLK